MRNDIKTRFQKGHTKGFKKGQSAWNKDKPWPKKTRKKISEKTKIAMARPEIRSKMERTWFKRGQDAYNKGKGKYFTYLQIKENEAGRKRPNQCEICGASNNIYFAHDHKTGKFRGWICLHCNTIIGFSRDNSEILIKIAKYLKDNE